MLFRSLSKGDKSKYINNVWNSEISTIYSDEINTGQTQTRQSRDTSIKKFLATKRSNQRDYADACFRYLRMSGIISISHRGHSVFIDESKYKEVDFILSNVDREPIYIDEIDSFKKYLFDPTIPSLFTDNKANLVNQIMKLSSYTRQDLVNKSINELKDLKDEIIEEKREALFSDQVRELKSYSLYSEIIDTFNEIITDDIYDAPLILEWNTWRAMTMLNGGIIKGNFKVDDSGQPMSTAQGNMPDIECDYGEFALSVEVTLQAGQRQYETEGEPVARHYGQLKKRAGKETYCLFIAPTINHATLAHFFTLNKTEIFYYGGKARIIPLELDQFMRLVENSYNFKGNPTESHVKSFLSFASNLVDKSANEKVWIDSVYDSINDWPSN